MKKLLKRIGQMTLLTILTLTSVGCVSQIKDLQGKWADVNSSARLEIKGNKIIISYGEWSDSYKYKIRTEYETTYLSNVKEDGAFGIMTELEVCEDGSLRAYDMILDGDSHQYRFVREENLEAEYEVQDLSRELPKTVKSKEIESIGLYFDNEGGSYELEELWPSGRYTWEITKREDGDYDMLFMATQSSYMVVNFREVVSAEYVLGFAELLEETGVLENNGYIMKTNQSDPNYLLYGEYVTGEEVYIAAEGEPAKDCVFDLKTLMDYARMQDLFNEKE